MFATPNIYISINAYQIKLMTTIESELADEIAEVVGDGLRSVATYDRGDYDTYYIRDDIKSTYSEEEIAGGFN